MITPRFIIHAAIEAGVATWGGEPMCRQGHVITGVNVSIEHRSEGRTLRRCKQCKRDRQREYRARKRAEGKIV